MIKFETGTLYMTRGVAALVQGNVLPAPALAHLLHRHRDGDWGDLCAYDRQVNELALEDGSRLMSVYQLTAPNVTVWLITEADRSATTFLLPEEY